MAAGRIRVAKNKADLVKALVKGSDSTGPFETFADVMAFAASLGVRRKRRVALGEISVRDPGPISVEIFVSRGYDRVIKLLAITETKDPKVLSPFDATAEEQRNHIFEEYANGGLEILREELRGAGDYTDRILLILMSERFKENEPVGDFDLRNFLM